MKKFFMFFALLASSSHALAEEAVNLCVSYYRSTMYPQWSKPYLVHARMLQGYELNQKINCYYGNCFDQLTYYAVVFWGEGQASILSLGNIPYSVTYSSTYLDTHDQEGRAWKIAGTLGGSCPFLLDSSPY